MNFAIRASRINVLLVGSGSRGEVAADESTHDSVPTVHHHRDVVRVLSVLCWKIDLSKDPESRPGVH